MNFYPQINQFIDEIEARLDADFRLTDLAQKHALNLALVERVFPLLAGMSLSEYIRKRRLTLAARDLVQSDLRIIDVAMKYGYDSATAFSRAFERYHSLKPSEVKLHASKLKYCHKLYFRSPEQVTDVKYEIVDLPVMDLFGIYVNTDDIKIKHDAPQLFIDLETQRPELSHPDYGLTDCSPDAKRETDFRYWVLWKNSYPNLKKYKLSASRWLKFRLNSQEAAEIQEMSRWFWENFLPTCCYDLKPFPELESYHDGITDFYIPIK